MVLITAGVRGENIGVGERRMKLVERTWLDLARVEMELINENRIFLWIWLNPPVVLSS